jgi:Cellulase (glycosyl hydrolase family 5)
MQIRIVLLVAYVLLAACGSNPTPPDRAPSNTPAQALPTSMTPTVQAVPTPKAPTVSIFGVEAQSINEAGGLPLVTQAGMEWVRLNGVLWMNIEKSEGVYDWSGMADLEPQLVNAAKHNLRLILIIRGTPPWAQLHPNTPCGPVKPEKIPTFAAFMSALVTRYSAAPYNVRYWEIWNEPDVDYRLFDQNMRDTMPFGCYGNEDDPDYGGGSYADLLKAAYRAIKQADPAAVVVSGGLLLDCIPSGAGKGCDSRTAPSNPKPSRFLEGVLRAGGGDYFDMLSFHAYDNYRYEPGVYGLGGFDSAWNTTGPALHNKARFIRSVLNQYGHGDKPLINTETGIGCFETARCDAGYERTVANYVPVTYAAALSERFEGQIMYSLQSTWLSSNLLNADLSPRPGFVALAEARKRLDKAAFVRMVDDQPGYRIYELQTPRGLLWVAYPITRPVLELVLATPPSRISLFDGTDVPPATQVNPGTDTLYVEWTR